MNWDAIAKYGFAAVINAALFYLVLVGKVDVSIFVGLAMSELAGLGVYHASGGSGPAEAPALPSTPLIPKA